MKIRVKKKALSSVFAMQLFVLCLTMLAISPATKAYADGSSEPLTIRQSVTTKGNVPEDLDLAFNYELIAEENAPLPINCSGSSCVFELSGNQSKTFTLTVDDTQTGSDVLIFPKTGVYIYQIRCTTEPFEGKGILSVDNDVYRIRVAVENDGDAGLRVGWVEIKDEKGEKPESIVYTHSYEGVEQPKKPGKRLSIFGIKLPQTGDAVWGLIQMSATICAVGVVLIVIGVVGRRRKRNQK